MFVGQHWIGTENDSKEHIVPNAIGGRRTVRGFVCGKCNSRVGQAWGGALCKQLAVFSTMLNVRRQRGHNQPIGVETLHGRKLALVADGSLSPARPVVTKSVESSTTRVDVRARSMGELHKIVSGISSPWQKYLCGQVSPGCRSARRMVGQRERTAIGFGSSGVDVVEARDCLATRQTAPDAAKKSEQTLAGGSGPALKASGSAEADDLTHEEPEVASAGVDEYPLEDVRMAAQMHAPHTAGLVLVSKGPLEPFASLALHPLATIPPVPAAVRVHDGLQVLLALPATTTTVRLRDVAAKSQLGDVRENGVAVVPLVRNDLLDRGIVPGHRLHLLEGLLQRLVKRRRVPPSIRPEPSPPESSRTRGPPPARPCTQGACGHPSSW